MLIKATVVFHVDIEVGDNLTPEEVKWRIEESYCLDNVVNSLHGITSKAEEADLCGACPMGAAFVGEIPFDSIGKLRA
jgi:hypothetical protein